MSDKHYLHSLEHVATEIWTYVLVIKGSAVGRTFHYDTKTETELFNVTLNKIPHTRGNINIMDLSEFALTSTDCSSYEDFKAKFTEFLAPKKFEFYFILGQMSNFDEGYVLGTGKLLPFNSLPSEVRDYVLQISRVDEPGRDVTVDWFMAISIESMGKHRSLEIAIQQLRRNIGIYKLTHLILTDDFYRMESYISPYMYVRKLGSEILVYGYDYGTSFYRDKSRDELVSRLSELIKIARQELNEVERGITNAVDSIGIIEASTPLHLKFVLPVFSLEGLVLSDEDKESSLRKKLSEKIALLVLESSNWMENGQYLGHRLIKVSNGSESQFGQEIGKNIRQAIGSCSQWSGR